MLRIFLLILLFFSVTAIAEIDFYEGKLAHDSELSVFGGQGNTTYETYQAKISNRYIKEKYEFTVHGHYTYGTFGEARTEIARNWNFGMQAGLNLNERVKFLLGANTEGDMFAGYTERNNTDVGITYIHVRSDDLRWRSEVAYRHTVERRIDAETLNQNKARFYTELESQIRSGMSAKFWLEYIPNFTDEDDYMINAEPSLSSSITDIFSLKLSYKAMYDNVPALATRKRLDTVYATSLLAHF